MTLHIHYRASDGEIFGWENTDVPHEQIGLEIKSLDDIQVIPNRTLHKIDPITLDLIDKTEEERAIALLPPAVTEAEINTAIRTELSATDAFMMPDRPISDSVRLAWREYRQMLRDLSKLAPASRVQAWSVRPDGRDAAANLRNRRYAD
jgi:hypothetical protein